MRSPRRQVAALAVLATALTAVLIPAAVAAPADSPRELRVKLAEAITHEKRALELLKKKPPRPRTARLAVIRSLEILKGMQGPGLPYAFWQQIQRARAEDGDVVAFLGEDRPHRPSVRAGIYYLEAAMQSKETALALLLQPPTAQGPQCADGKDNDGDGLVDARHDSGCSNGKDATERSGLTTRLVLTRNGLVSVITGTVSGPFARIEVTLPAGDAFDTKQAPTVGFSNACRFPSARKLECVMKDGLANPRHVVKARFKLTKVSVLPLRILIRNFIGRGRAQSVSATPSLRFKLSYTHEGLSHVCASIEATSGAFLELTLEGPNGQKVSGTLQLKQKDTATAPGGFSFRILEFGTYRVTIKATKNGKSVEKTQTIGVTDAPGDSRCSATGAPPP